MDEDFEDSEEIWNYKSLRRRRKSCEALPSQNAAPQKQRRRKAKDVTYMKISKTQTDNSRVASRKSKPLLRVTLSRPHTETIEISDSSERLSDDAGPETSACILEAGKTKLNAQDSNIRDGACPHCQMPFVCLTGMPPQSHVLQCMDQPLSTTEECPAGVDCVDKNPSHYRRYQHTGLAAHRSCCDEMTQQHNESQIDDQISEHVPSTLGTGPQKSSCSEELGILDSPTLHVSQDKAECLMKNLIECSKNLIENSIRSCDNDHNSEAESISDIDAEEGEADIQKNFTRIRGDQLGPCESMFDGNLSDVALRDVSDMLADALESGSESDVKEIIVNDDDDEKSACDADVDDSTTSSILDALQHAEDSINDCIFDVNDTENSADDCIIESVIGVKENLNAKSVNSKHLCKTVGSVKSKLSVTKTPSKLLHKTKVNKRLPKTPPSLSKRSVSKRKDKRKNKDRSQTSLLSFFAPKKNMNSFVDNNRNTSQSRLEAYFTPKKCLNETSDSKLNESEQMLKPVSDGLNAITELTSSTMACDETKTILPMKTNNAENLNHDTLQMNAETTEEKVKFLQIFKHPPVNHKQSEIMKGGINSDSKADAVAAVHSNAVGTAVDGTKNQYGGAGRRGKRPCPFYKKIPGTGITVDAFSYGVIPDCTAYILTHFHYDHYGGLTKNFKQPIYCSKVTGNLVCRKLGVDRSCVHSLPLNELCYVEGAEVTLMEANHCPGAVIILFKLPNGTCHLHTGDFRATREMETYPSLTNCLVNQLYLDTTYCDPAYTFPLQQAVIDLAVSIATQALEEHPQTLVVCGTYTIGKERVFTALADALHCQICVKRDKQVILECLEDPALTQRLTLNPQQTCLHVLPMNKLKYLHLTEYLNGLKSFNKVLAFEPTGWTHSKKTVSLQNIKPKCRSNDITIYGIPYSEHSSYSELKSFVQFVRPLKILPTVNNGNAESRHKMESLFKGWLEETVDESMKDEEKSVVKKQRSINDFIPLSQRAKDNKTSLPP